MKKEERMVVLGALLILTVTVPLASAATHSLRYFYTGVTPGINLPEFSRVGLVDREQFVYYDSVKQRDGPKAEWMQKVVADDPGYFDRMTQILKGWEETFKVSVQNVMQRFNQTKGVHTWQYMYGCELEDDGSKRGYVQYGYDGEDFVSLNLNTGTWIATTPQAVITKNKWDSNVGFTNYWRNTYIQNVCIEWLQKYVGYGRDTLERKVSPEVSLFQKDSSSPVVCHATGFFPKAVMISWQKNGEDLNEDVELRETVPNQDGTFQKRSILTLSPEELDRNQYSCVIQHSSLEKEKVLKMSDRVLRSGGGSVGGSTGVIIGVVVAVLLAVIAGVGFFLWKRNEKKNRGDALETSSARTSDSAEAEQLNPPVQKNP